TPTNTCTTGTSSAITTDPNTVLLMHMDGTDNGTTFNDQTGKTVTRYGDTKTIIATKKFGSASAYFDGTGDYMTIPYNSDFYFGSNNFTIDLWVKFNSLPTNDSFTALLTNFASVSSKWGIWLYNYNGTYQWNVGECDTSGGCTGAGWRYVNTNGIVVNNWYHVAFVRNGNNWYVFQNGVMCGSAFIDSKAMLDIGGTFYIGREGTVRELNGQIDELRISKGIARWTSGFTPPNSQYYWWNWGCNGSNGGTNSTCGANKYQ
ncbi:MAG: LamG domain-containing protein, partial [Candidatus Pacebacteria bacterium]|nr:LamG domain-containing protein [Candidatus Paceibacterota bacterium]